MSIYRNELSQDFLDAYRVYADGLCGLLRNPPAPAEGSTPPSEVDISSIGKLEQHVQRSYGSAEFGLQVLDIGLSTELLIRQAVVCTYGHSEGS
jgi:hypothetical protein